MHVRPAGLRLKYPSLAVGVKKIFSIRSGVLSGQHRELVKRIMDALNQAGANARLSERLSKA